MLLKLCTLGANTGEKSEQFRSKQVSAARGNPQDQGAFSPGNLHNRGHCQDIRRFDKGNSESRCVRATDSPQPSRTSEVLDTGCRGLPPGQPEGWVLTCPPLQETSTP